MTEGLYQTAPADLEEKEGLAVSEVASGKKTKREGTPTPRCFVQRVRKRLKGKQLWISRVQKSAQLVENARAGK